MNALSVACPYCRVSVGWRCRTRGGQITTPHAARRRDAAARNNRPARTFADLRREHATSQRNAHHHDVILWCALIAELWANDRMTAAHGSAERLWISVRLAGDFIDTDTEVDR